MLKTTVCGVEVCFSVGFPAVVALLCFFDKTGSAALCLYAALLHESAHIAVSCAFGFRPRSLVFGAYGMRMELPPLPYGAMVAVALSGPACNLVFAGVSALLGAEKGVLVHLALGGFNLLPLTPLDGGQALFSLLAPKTGEHAAKTAVAVTSALLAIPLFCGAAFVFFSSGYNPSLLVLCGYLLFLVFFKKKD